MSIPVTMKAVVLHDADDMRLEPRAVPQPGPGEVRLKVNVASICGTDVKVLHRKLRGSRRATSSWGFMSPILSCIIAAFP